MLNWLKQNRGLVFGALTLLSLFGGFIVYNRPSEPPPLEISTPQPTATPAPAIAATPAATPEPTTPPPPLRVYISGEVNTPDVYLLPPGSIIKDAIIAAGGPTGAANLDAINQALELLDQQHIHVPAKTETLPTPPVVEGGVLPPTPALESRTQSLNIDTASPAGRVININSAGVTELDLLPGIGPAIAQRIIDYRAANGRFTAIEELINVRGIGEATFEKLKDYVTVE